MTEQNNKVSMILYFSVQHSADGGMRPTERLGMKLYYSPITMSVEIDQKLIEKLAGQVKTQDDLVELMWESNKVVLHLR